MKKIKFLKIFKFCGGISIIYYIALIALLWYLIIPHTSIYYNINLFDPYTKRLNTKDLTMIRGEEFKLYLINVNKRVTFSSLDIKVADVNILGKITAYRPGTTFIRVKYRDDVLKCRVRVIDINKKSLELKVGETKDLDIKGAFFGVKWKSSNKSIAKVNSFGKVTAKSPGKAKIYGEVRGKTLTCNVTVK